MRRLAAVAGAALLFVLGAVGVVIGPRLGRSWAARVAVSGHSMEPTLLDGDWLLVDPAAYAHRAPQAGELVVTRDPRDPGRVLVKRVAEVAEDGTLILAGDHPAHADDSVAIGPVAESDLVGRPWFRYWPPSRAGRV